MDKWRDMGDAPRDRPVLVICEDGRQHVAERCVSADTGDRRWRYAALWHGEDHLSVLCDPVKWQPLPSPPEDENG